MGFPGADWLQKGKELLDNSGALKDGFDKAKNNEYVQDAGNITKVNYKLERIESELKDVSAEKINISSNKHSELGEFLQKGLKAMDQDVGTIDGKAGAGTVGELNGFFAAKIEGAAEGINPLRDKYEDLNPIKDISELTGRHVQAFVDELRDRDILDSGTPEMLKEFGQALRDIDNKDLQEYANDFDPNGANQAPAPAGSDVVPDEAPAPMRTR